jgi:hypothetical protein
MDYYTPSGYNETGGLVSPPPPNASFEEYLINQYGGDDVATSRLVTYRSLSPPSSPSKTSRETSPIRFRIPPTGTATTTASLSGAATHVMMDTVEMMDAPSVVESQNANEVSPLIFTQRPRRTSFSNILTHADDLSREEKSIRVLFAKPSSSSASSNYTAPTLSTPPKLATVDVTYADPQQQNGRDNHCRAEAPLDMSFSALVSRIVDNMRRQRLVNEATKLRFELREYRLINVPSNASMSPLIADQHTNIEYMVWIHAQRVSS